MGLNALISIDLKNNDKKIAKFLLKKWKIKNGLLWKRFAIPG